MGVSHKPGLPFPAASVGLVWNRRHGHGHVGGCVVALLPAYLMSHQVPLAKSNRIQLTRAWECGFLVSSPSGPESMAGWLWF